MNNWDTGDCHEVAKDCSWAEQYEGSTIFLTPEVQSVIRKMCKEIKVEWQMLLTGKETKDGVFVTGYWIPKQEVTGATVKNLECVDKQVIDEKGIVCTIHSHSNMGVFFSGVDEEFTNNSLIKNHIVVNNHGKMKACMRYELPCKMTKFFDASVQVTTPVIDKVEGITNVVLKTIVAKTYVSPYSSGQYGWAGMSKSKKKDDNAVSKRYDELLNRHRKYHAITEEGK